MLVEIFMKEESIRDIDMERERWSIIQQKEE